MSGVTTGMISTITINPYKNPTILKVHYKVYTECSEEVVGKVLKEDMRCAHRHRNNPGTMNGTCGFRCAADVKSL